MVHAYESSLASVTAAKCGAQCLAIPGIGYLTAALCGAAAILFVKLYARLTSSVQRRAFDWYNFVRPEPPSAKVPFWVVALYVLIGIALFIAMAAFAQRQLARGSTIDLGTYGALALILGWWIAVSSYPRLPESIPVHFGLKGQADGWGARWTIFLLPVIATLIFALDMWIFTRPDAVARTPSEVALAIHLLVMEMTALFAYITWRTSLVAFGRASGLGYGFVVLFLAVMVTAGYMAMLASKYPRY